nr:S8 family serine peptidase [Thermoplasmata archaeon]
MSSARANALKTFSVVGIALLMVWSTVTSFSAVAADERDVYIVSMEDDTSPGVFRTTGTKVLVDYNNGLYLVRATESQAFAMNGLGLGVVKFKNLRTIDLFPSDVTFDTSVGAPTAPSVMSGLSWDRGTYIVQFIGPYKSEWLESVENLGGKVEKLLHAFSAVVKMSPDVKSRVSDLPFVNWVGDYKPWYKISSEMLNGEGNIRVAIHTFEDSQRAALSEKLVKWGVSVLMSYPQETIIAYVDTEILPYVASLPEVMQVFRDYNPETTGIVVAKIHGAFDSWYTERSGLPTTLTGRSPGPDGIDYTADDIYEVIGIQDSGFDICDPDSGHPDFFLGPVGDRVIRMIDQTGDSCPDGWISGTAHGTHVAGDSLSNGYSWEYFLTEPTMDADWEKSEGPGMAPEAKLSIDGVQRFGGGLLAKPDYWDLQYSDGAHINTNSYGSQPAPYGGDSYQVDKKTNDDNDRLIFFAASNEGPDLNTLSSNTQGKNGLSIGASLNFRPDYFDADNPNLIADFSSRGGPSQSQGRLKPDLVAVGTAGVAPMGHGEWLHNEASGIGNPQPDCIMEVDVYNYNNPTALDGDGICDYRYMGGTSAASPHAAGLGALVREYLREVAGISDPFAINSQLVKALMINGAVRMDEALYDYPGYDQGWGRINLENSLFPQAPRTNKWEEGTMTTTGQWTPSFSTYVQSDDAPLKVTLVWVDEPWEALFRDLNLKVTSPSPGGDVYYGNIYGTVGQFDGWSKPNPSPADANPLWDRVGNDGWDDLNNVEQVEVQFPEVGDWLVEVVGWSIPTSAPFAIVVGADFGPQEEFKIILDTDAPLSMEATQNGDVFFPFTVTNFGTSDDNFFMSSTTILGITINFNENPLLGVQSKETVSTFAIISVAEGVSCGVHDLMIKGTSLGNTTITDQLELEMSIKCDLVVTPFQLTNATVDELDPSVLTFNDGTKDHIFIAYRKTTAVAPDDQFGGVNVWVANTTLDGEGLPILPFNHTEVSRWNDDPNDLRWTYIPTGTYQNRIILTWTGDDPEASGPAEDYDSYGVLYFSDPPYTQWNKTVIERNAGSSAMNEARVSIPLWRDDGTLEGEFIWVFEHLDFPNPDANNPIRVQTWVAISHDGGETFPVCDGTHPDCKRISPSDMNFYFFPNACIDSNEVLWVFFYYRLPAGNDRDLMVRLYDGDWQGDDTPINPNDDVSLLWNSDATNLQWPACVGDVVGGNNRMNVMVTNDQGLVDLTIWAAYLEGDYDSANPPFGLDRTTIGISPDVKELSPPMGTSVSNSNYDRRPITQMVTTNDGYTWIMYIENANEFGVGNLMTVATNDTFNNSRTFSTLTADSYAKGHQMTDTLTVNVTRHNVYEVYHASKGTESDVNYDVYLLVYHKGWEDDPDTVGPVTDPVVAVPNPFDISIEGKDLQLFATVSDTSTGMSNVASSEWIEVPLSVVDPRLINWTSALPMAIGSDSPTETGMASFVPSNWDGGETHRLC